MKEHAVRVGNEAEFILNRARADDVKEKSNEALNRKYVRNPIRIK